MPRLRYPHGPAVVDHCRHCGRKVWLAPVDGVRTVLEWFPVDGLAGELTKVRLGLKTFTLRDGYAYIRLPENLDSGDPVHAQHRCAIDDSPPF